MKVASAKCVVIALGDIEWVEVRCGRWIGYEVRRLDVADLGSSLELLLWLTWSGGRSGFGGIVEAK